MGSICALLRERQPHPTTGISPATSMRNWSLLFLRRQVLSTFREGPETHPRKRLEVAPRANRKRVSGRNLCRQVPDSWAQFGISTATGPETISPWLGYQDSNRARDSRCTAKISPDFKSLVIEFVGLPFRRRGDFLLKGGALRATSAQVDHYSGPLLTAATSRHLLK